MLPKEILVYFDEVKGYGGLPVGVSGLVSAMLSGGIDSPVAAWQMMKRGCRVHFVHFHSYPLVDRSSIEKAGELAQMLTRHQFSSHLSLVPMGEAQKQIILATPPAYRVILYRRFMMRVTEALARKRGAKAIITGESCGQVSSQTLDNLAAIDVVANMPVLRPLIGFNKEEIINVARDLGTFPISILPDQDCCSLFVPRHPETHAKLETVARLESVLPMEELVQQALENTDSRDFLPLNWRKRPPGNRRDWGFRILDEQRLLGDLLRGVSRSFYLTLRVLPEELRRPVGLAYLLARAADTIADSRLVDPELRLMYLLKFRDQTAGPVNSDDLREIGEAVAGYQELSFERELLMVLPQAFDLLEGTREPDRGMVRGVVATLTEGMEFDLRTFPAEGSGNLAALPATARWTNIPTWWRAVLVTFGPGSP